MDDNLSFGEWLNQLYHEDALKKRGKYFSVAQWSLDRFDIGNAAMSNYMTGKRKPTGVNFDSLVAQLGLEVYTRLKRPIPEGIELEIIRAKVALRRAKPETKKKLIALIDSILDDSTDLQG